MHRSNSVTQTSYYTFVIVLIDSVQWLSPVVSLYRVPQAPARAANLNSTSVLMTRRGKFAVMRPHAEESTSWDSTHSHM